MTYDAALVVTLEKGRRETLAELRDTQATLISTVADHVSCTGAREFVLHGICRRLKVLARALDNVFTIHPPGRTDRLTWEELSDLNINLHAFVVNVFGSLDNIAWSFVLHHNLLVDVGGKMNVGLFNEKTSRHLPQRLADYLSHPRMLKWHNTYAKNYRDAVAHRIPLYVPPSTLDDDEAARHAELSEAMRAAYAREDIDAAMEASREQDCLGSLSVWCAQGFGPSDTPPIRFHPQMISDARTVHEVATTFATCFNERSTVSQ